MARAGSIQRRCQAALARALARSNPQASVDRFGYAATLAENFLASVDFSLVKKDFGEGAGHELDWKMRAAHSSSALAVNVLSPWRRDPRTLTLAGGTGFRCARFEKQCPTGLQGTPPHLDFVAEGDWVVGVESKCTEYLTGKPASFRPTYNRIHDGRTRSQWFHHLRALQANPFLYGRLDAAQLIKHALGLTHCFPERRIRLLYLYWEPLNHFEFTAFREHRTDLDAFANQVAGDEVEFLHSSYTELWKGWSDGASTSRLRNHVTRLRRRYEVAVE